MRIPSPPSEPDEIEAATKSVHEAVGSVDESLHDQGAEGWEVALVHRRVDALAAIARRMRLERDGAEYDAGLERANVEEAERERDTARALHDKCDARDIELGLCVPPWRQER